MNPLRREKLKLLAQSTFVFVVYVAAAKLGLRFAFVQANATAVWMPTGIAIAALLLGGYRMWAAVFAAAFVTNVTTGGTGAVASLGIAAGNALEAFTVAYLTDRFAHGKRAFERAADIFKFALFAVAGCAVSAVFGVTSLALSGLAEWETYFPTWITWWMGDLSGAAIIAPFFILWFTNYRITVKVKRILEVVLLVSILSAFSVFILKNSNIFIYLIFPIFVWAAFRFGQREVSTAVVVLTEVSLWGTLHGGGPFFFQARGSLNWSLILLDAAMSAVSVTLLVLAALITESKNARAADEAAFEGIGDGMVVLNRDERVAYVNPRAEEMLGWARAEMVGKSYADVIPMQNEDGTSVPPRERPLIRAFRTGEKIVRNPFGETHYYVRKDGSRFPVAYTKTPVVMNGEIVGAIDVFRDVAEEREAARERFDFISLVSHELRTPLSVIKIAADVLGEERSPDVAENPYGTGSYAQDIQAAVRRMADIINELTNVSRIESGTLAVATAPVDAVRLARRIAEMIAPRAKAEGLQLRMRLPEATPDFATDPLLLGIVFQNLLSNAVKYTPAGGTVDFSIVRDEDSLVVVVADTGYGIPEAEREQVFNKFFRGTRAAQEKSEGAGLGLFIVKGMVERLGGTISFVSKEDEGSTFVVRLPLSGRPLRSSFQGNGHRRNSRTAHDI